MNWEPDLAEVHYLGHTVDECHYYFDRISSPQPGLGLHHQPCDPRARRASRASSTPCRRTGWAKSGWPTTTESTRSICFPVRASSTLPMPFARIEASGYSGHYMNAFGSLDDMLRGRDVLGRFLSLAGQLIQAIRRHTGIIGIQICSCRSIPKSWSTVPPPRNNARQSAHVRYLVCRSLQGSPRQKRSTPSPTVPDGGLTTLLQLCESDLDTSVVTLSTEEEGIGILFGLWLGGQRGVLMMQSSGTGNCINALSLPASTRTPCLMLVTMRGQWGEFNPWQVSRWEWRWHPPSRPWASNAIPCNQEEDGRAGVFSAAADMVFSGGFSAAVLIHQSIIGTKRFDK